MCGIIHVKKEQGKLANASIVKRYRKQISRGTEGFGFLEIHNGFVGNCYHVQTEKEVMELLEKSTANEIMFHHRIPTSTPNIPETNHPIFVSNSLLQYDYYVIHNGVISNDNVMYESHKKLGFEYTTEIKKEYTTKSGLTYFVDNVYNDSESFAIDLCLSIENKTSMDSRGSIAFIAVQLDKTTRQAISLYYGHNDGNPLCIQSNETGFLSLTSENGKEVAEDVLYRYNYATGKTTYEIKDIGTYIVYSSGRNYTTYGFTPNDDDGYDYGSKEELQAEQEHLINLESELKVAKALNDDPQEIEELEMEIEAVKEDISELKWIV